MTPYILSFMLTTTFFLLGGIHIFWALGGQWGFDSSLPTNEEGARVLNPGKTETVIVGTVLLVFGIVYLAKSGLIDFNQYEYILKYVRWVIPAVFILRAIGEFKYVGFFKKVKQTRFGRADTKLFSPLCLTIGLAGLIIQLS